MNSATRDHSGTIANYISYIYTQNHRKMLLTNILLFLGGLGMPEIILILLIVILLFGAKKIPELAKGLGKGIREFKDASKDIKSEIEKGMEDPKSQN